MLYGGSTGESNNESVETAMKPNKILLVVVILLTTLSAFADWQLNGPVTPPTLGGTYWSLAHGTSYPPLPCIPDLFKDGPVYEIVGYPGNYTYDDTGNPDHTQSE